MTITKAEHENNQPNSNSRASWQPGRPVATAQDREDWQQWRKNRKREQQRERRAANPRIDYYPDDEARSTIDSMWAPRAGCDLSSVINRIVGEWAEHCHRNKERGSTGRP